MLTCLMNNPAKAIAKFKKFQENFSLQYDGDELCLYRKQAHHSDHSFMVLIPTAEEELELIVKCHREEFHEDNGGGYTFMRDMLTNNCHITNFIKKIDYIQSICK